MAENLRVLRTALEEESAARVLTQQKAEQVWGGAG